MHLSDHFMGLFAYILYFFKRKNLKIPTFEHVKADVNKLITASESSFAKQQGKKYKKSQYEGARFAVIAWIDETILNSNWKDKDKWDNEKLQVKYYHMDGAGDVFFQRLNELGKEDRAVMEVYYLCLALGFKGRYDSEEDRPVLEGVKAEILSKLLPSSGSHPALPEKLFPDAYTPFETQNANISFEHRKRSLKLPMLIASPFLLGIFLFITFDLWLGYIGNTILAVVP